MSNGTPSESKEEMKQEFKMKTRMPVAALRPTARRIGGRTLSSYMATSRRAGAQSPLSRRQVP